MPDPTPRTVLITGCSSGIGECAAYGLKARGWRVFAATRSTEAGARLEADGLETVRLDYDDSDSINAALEHVLTATGGRLDALFNNGGMAQPGAIEDLSRDAMRAQFETNFLGWHDLTRRVIPVMRRQGGGRIVFCSSVLGFVAARFRGAYVASKFAVEGYADTLRLELKDDGIAVILIEPGPTTSNFRRRSVDRVRATIDVDGSVHRARYERELAGDHGQRGARFRRGPEAVLAKLMHALENPRPKARYRVTIPTHVAALLKRLLPTRALDRIVGG